MNYECHITVDTVYAEAATIIAQDLHWKTSEIARDPVLGNKNFFYLTTHSSKAPVIFARMEEACNVLEAAGVPVIRQKIELIIHDTKETNRAIPHQ
jgi:hypothetical protein